MKFIPKHYLLSDPAFWDPVFIEWNYTDTILLTSYDLLRNDALIYFLHSNSMTLKELMKENGFPETTKIFADSGIFMLEWFKLTKSKTFKQDYSNVNLSIDEIIEGYKLIDPDYLVAPDEIILPNEKKEVVKEKTEKIKEGILKTLDEFPRQKIVGVIQGIKKETMDEIYDFEKSNGITIFARGGLIPIKRKNNLYCDVLRYSRQLTTETILHAFGIVELDQINCYGKCAQIDSFDSTIVRALTANLYWIDTSLIKYRFNDQVIKDCDCIYCKNLTELKLDKYDFASKVIMQNLYLHNITIIFEQCNKMKNFRN